MNKNYTTTLSRNGIKIEKRIPETYKNFLVNCAWIFALLLLGGMLATWGGNGFAKKCNYEVYPQNRGTLDCIFY